ncbi:hypothetical protein MtrunA17_Chr4g0069031 [Medicago truncatula]|uniref:At2g35280-like TPR domain-containing protein n=1 Tax=Medicago truncatula TaxID=3880 RepID=A0A396IFQ7_MEDTR|nr:hypothetical protein MtrunA17_Chr4g0069031 [Medicago truncatula]
MQLWISLHWFPWFTDEKETSFFSRCRESGNLEIIYREGMVQYFSTLMVDLGLKNLKKTALEGHHEAKYVYSMLLMANCDDDEGRKLGFDLFDELKNSTGITIVGCRKRVKSVRTITMLYAQWKVLMEISCFGRDEELTNNDEKYSERKFYSHSYTYTLVLLSDSSHLHTYTSYLQHMSEYIYN